MPLPMKSFAVSESGSLCNTVYCQMVLSGGSYLSVPILRVLINYPCSSRFLPKQALMIMSKCLLFFWGTCNFT